MCARHVKNYLISYLNDKVGVGKENQNRVIRDVFDVNGLITLTDSKLFENTLNVIKGNVDHHVCSDKFSRYADSTLRDSLRNGLILPSIVAGVPPTWTNNSCESINHVLKSSLDWRKLPWHGALHDSTKYLGTNDPITEEKTCKRIYQKRTKESQHRQVKRCELAHSHVSNRK